MQPDRPGALALISGCRCRQNAQTAWISDGDGRDDPRPTGAGLQCRWIRTKSLSAIITSPSPAGQATPFDLLAQNLGVLLGEPVHQQRDYDGDHQCSGGQVAPSGVEDRRGDDGAINSRGAPPPQVLRGRPLLDFATCRDAGPRTRSRVASTSCCELVPSHRLSRHLTHGD